jgi:hypothetical protein
MSSTGIDAIIAEKFDPRLTPMLPFGANNSSVRARDAKAAERHRALVLEALLNGERLNAKQSRRRWKYERLAPRISELRKAGYRITSVIGRDRFSTYWMEQEEIERVRSLLARHKQDRAAQENAA